ncbi:hypothetical protein RJ640_009017, partial [Escallonia rubra]
YGTEASPYNYSASIKCLAEPPVPQYDGGLLVNPKFDNGLEGWNVYGNGKIAVRKSGNGNNYVVAYDRGHAHDTIMQKLNLQDGLYYSFSAWVQISEGKETVSVALKDSRNPRNIIGSVVAQSGCWSMIKGGIAVNASMSAELYFEVRKRKVRLQVSDKQGKKIQGAQITIEEKKPEFQIGCAVAAPIINTTGYQDWFVSKGFSVSVFNNEMKWYYNEKLPGTENYTVPDAMLAFFEKHGVAVRGHCVHWDLERQNMPWTKALPNKELWDALWRRMDSVMTRYAGKVIAWDVVNENVHFHYLEDRLGPNTSDMLYKRAAELDPKATLFLNEFKTLEYPEDMPLIPSRYIEKLDEIRSFPGLENKVIALGLQAHFNSYPNLPYVRACLDVLGETRMPIWLTEFDIGKGPNQAGYLEEVMREVYSHPAVEGIMLWPGNPPKDCKEECIRPNGTCGKMCLTDTNFKNLPTGDVVDTLMNDWNRAILKGNTDECGVYEHQVIYGEHLVTVLDPSTGKNVTSPLNVTRDNSEALDVKIDI